MRITAFIISEYGLYDVIEGAEVSSIEEAIEIVEEFLSEYDAVEIEVNGEVVMIENYGTHIVVDKLPQDPMLQQILSELKKIKPVYTLVPLC